MDGVVVGTQKVFLQIHQKRLKRLLLHGRKEDEGNAASSENVKMEDEQTEKRMRKAHIRGGRDGWWVNVSEIAPRE